MPIKVKAESYGTRREFLATSQGYLCVERMLSKGDALAIEEDGRKVVKAGTPYPSNDAKCIGFVFNDYDVTDGDQAAAIMIGGNVKTAALPVLLSSAAKTALSANGFKFYPIGDYEITPILSADALSIAEGDEKGTEYYVVLSIANDQFRENGAEDVSNWTVSGESATNLGLESVEWLSNGEVGLHLVATAATTAGTLSIAPKAAIVGLGNVPASADVAVVA